VLCLGCCDLYGVWYVDVVFGVFVGYCVIFVYVGVSGMLCSVLFISWVVVVCVFGVRSLVVKSM